MANGESTHFPSVECGIERHQRSSKAPVIGPESRAAHRFPKSASRLLLCILPVVLAFARLGVLPVPGFHSLGDGTGSNTLLSCVSVSFSVSPHVSACVSE